MGIAAATDGPAEVPGGSRGPALGGGHNALARGGISSPVFSTPLPKLSQGRTRHDGSRTARVAAHLLALPALLDLFF